MKARMKDVARSMDGTQTVSFTLEPGDYGELYDKWKDKDLELDVKQYRRHRSKEANAYCWALCSEIGRAMKPPLAKEEVYRTAIRDVGQYTPLKVIEEAAEEFARIWSNHGVGWFVDFVDHDEPGTLLAFAYNGSSTYDTAQMSTLLDYLIEECRQMEIPIRISDKELQQMKDTWNI